MKIKLLTLLFLLTYTVVSAKVSFSFSPESIGSVNRNTVSNMENATSALLTEINRADRGDGVLNLSGISMENGAKDRLLMFWDNLPFSVTDAKIAQPCLKDHQGYQVRNIKIRIKPKDDTYTGKTNRELTISFNKYGVITGVSPTMEMHEDVKAIMDKGEDVEDRARRREILKWVEDFRNYYIEKNINALDLIFSDDALIITGSVVTRRLKGDNGPKVRREVQYTEKSKQEYIKSLKNIFSKNSYLDVKFDKISVSRHGSKPDVYGVTLFQTWRSSTGYSDKGWLFLLWDFSNPESPQIHVRSWQDEETVKLEGVVNENFFFLE